MNLELMEKTHGNNSAGAFLGVITGVSVTGMGVLTLNPLLVGANSMKMATGAATGAASRRIIELISTGFDLNLNYPTFNICAL